MQQEVFLIGAFQRIDELLVIARAQRGDNQGLGFATGEYRRAMRAREHINLRDNRTHIGKPAPVNALFSIQNAGAHNVAFQPLKRSAHGIAFLITRSLVQQFVFHRIAQSGNRFLTGLLVGLLIGGFKAGFGKLRNFCFQRAVVFFFHFARLFGGFFRHADASLNNRLEVLVAEHNGAQHNFFGQLVSFRLNHQHGIGRAGHN